MNLNAAVLKVKQFCFGLLGLTIFWAFFSLIGVIFSWVAALFIADLNLAICGFWWIDAAANGFLVFLLIGLLYFAVMVAYQFMLLIVWLGELVIGAKELLKEVINARNS